MKDLTKGKPSTLILAFALPIFFANLLQLTYSLVDTRIVGTFLGEDALAAVGATTTLSNLIVGFLQGLSGGFAIIIAQKFGAKDYKNVKKSFAMSLTMGTGIAIFFTVFGLLFLQPILNILNVPADLMATAKSYIFVIIAGLVATFLYDACAAALRSLGDTVTPLVILAISVALNIVGDLLFVVVLKSGVRGAAIATVLAQAIAFVVCWIYMVKRYELLRLSREDFKDPNPVMVKNMLGAGMSMGFMSSLINIGSLTLQTAINKLGNDYIVAQTAARKLTEMFMIMFTVFGNTMATYCGQNLGAGKQERIRQGFFAGLKMIWTICVPMIVLYFLAGRWLLYLFMDQPTDTAMHTGILFLRILSPFYLVVSAKLVADGILRGTGLMKQFMVTTFTDLLLRVTLAIVLSRVLGVTGIWCAWPVGWSIATILSLLFYRRGGWERENV